MSTAGNIKSKQNQQSVLHALKRAIERLKLEKETPPNGAVLLCGLCSMPNQPSCDVVYFFQPPLPVQRFVYFCDKKFHLDSILPLYEHNEDTASKYAVCVVRGSDSEIFHYYPTVDRFEEINQSKGFLRNKHGRGGFSQNRYQRLRDNDVHAIIVKICEMCVEACMSSSNALVVKGLVLVGNGERKRQVADRLVEYLPAQRNENSFLFVLKSDGSSEQSKEMARSLICEQICPKEQRNAEKEIEEMVERQPDVMLFGLREVLCGLENGMVRKMFVVKRVVDDEVMGLGKKVEGTCVEVVCFDVSMLLERFGGVVAIKWY